MAGTNGDTGMKRFSMEENREFEIGGEIFKWKVPYWEDMAKVFDGDLATEAAPSPTPIHDMVEGYIRRIEMFIDPADDGVKRWRTAARRKTNPIPYGKFGELYTWLLEVTSGRRPTETSSPSQVGR